MPYVITKATQKLHNLIHSPSRIKAVPGGTSAGKTVGAMQVLIDLSQTDKLPTITSVVSESLPHIKRGSERDFLNIMKEHGYYQDSRWNMSDHTYEFETGSKIEFFSVDQASKVRGPRRDRLFMNEANNTPFETFEQLELRTKEFVLLDWNPTNEFWYYTDVKDIMPSVEELTLTYKDNEALDPRIVQSIESRKHRTGWWKVYGLGQLGEVEGKIYTDWEIIPEIPHQARLLRYGLDFGYTNDPTSIIAIYSYNGGIILDEICYQTGLLNGQIKDILLANPRALVIADSAEPKSIDEIKSYGITILPSVKGKDSVLNGINYVQEQRISMTARSVNLIKEYRNYLWIVDDNGKMLNEPEHEYSHAMDAVRYGLAYDINYKRPAVRWPTKERTNPAR